MSKMNGVTALPAQSRNWVLFRLVVRWGRPLLILSMYTLLFLPWWDRARTDFAPGCEVACGSVNGFAMWLAYAAWLLCLPAIPLATLLPTGLVASLWPKWWVLPPYYISLVMWLLNMLFFAYMNTATPIDETTYLTPYVGLALAVAALGVESVYLIIAWKRLNWSNRIHFVWN